MRCVKLFKGSSTLPQIIISYEISKSLDSGWEGFSGILSNSWRFRSYKMDVFGITEMQTQDKHRNALKIEPHTKSNEPHLQCQ